MLAARPRPRERRHRGRRRPRPSPKPVAVPPEDAGARARRRSGGRRGRTATSGRRPSTRFTDFDGDADPVLTFGAGAVTSVDPAGVLFAYTPSTGEVARVDAADEETVAARWQVAAGRRRRRRADHVGRRALGRARRDRAHPLLDGREVDLAGVARVQRRPRRCRPPALDGRIASPSRIAAGSSPSASTAASRVVLVDDVRAPGRAARARRMPPRRVGRRHGAGAPAPATPGRPCRARRGDGRRRPRLRSRTATPWCSTIARSGKTWAASDGYGAHRQLGRAARERARRRDDRAERPRHAADDREDPGAAGRRRRRVRRAAGPVDAAAGAAERLRRERRRPRGRRRRRRAAARSDASTWCRTTSSSSSRSTTRHPAPISFGYAVGDGRGGAAHADVTVTVRDPDENCAARAAAARTAPPSRAAAASRRPCSATGSTPTGTRSSCAPPRSRSPTSSRRPRRASSCSTSTAAPARRVVVALVVSDGRDDRGGVLTVSVRAPRRRAARRRAVRRARDRRRGDHGSIRCGTCAAAPGTSG